jgi:hypothetical protein
MEGWMPKMKAEEVFKFFFDFEGPMYTEKSDEFLGRPKEMNKEENIWSITMNFPMLSPRE